MFPKKKEKQPRARARGFSMTHPCVIRGYADVVRESTAVY